MKRNTFIMFMLAILVCTSNSTTMAKEKKKYKEIKIHQSSEIIHVSADRLWSIVREFDQVGVWLTSIDHAVGSGDPEFSGATCSERICYVNIKGYSKVSEKLTLFDDTKKELAYVYTGGGPTFVLAAGNHWTVKSVGPNQSILEMDVHMHFKKFMGTLLGWKIRQTVEKELPASLMELKQYAETGEISAAKKERIAEMERKKTKKAA